MIGICCKELLRQAGWEDAYQVTLKGCTVSKLLGGCDVLPGFQALDFGVVAPEVQDGAIYVFASQALALPPQTIHYKNMDDAMSNSNEMWMEMLDPEGQLRVQAEVVEDEGSGMEMDG